MREGERARPGDNAQLLAQAVAQHRSGRLNDAERLYSEILKAAPDEPDALHLLGALRHQRGDHASAIELIGRAIALNPQAPVYHYNLGNAQKELGLLPAAVSSYRQEIAINPGFAKAHNNLGNLLSVQRDIEGAIASFRRAITIDGAAAEFHTNLGGALAEAGRIEEAVASHRQALKLSPDFVEAQLNLGHALADSGHQDEARTHFQRALELDPANFEANEALALLYCDRAEFDEALAWCYRARALAPDRLSIYRVSLLSALYHPRLNNAERFAEHLRFGRAAAAQGSPSAPQFVNSHDPDRRLRIGWLSSDFRDHPVIRSVAPLLELRDRDRFEAYCYAEQMKSDAVTSHIRDLADAWRPTVGLTDAELAKLIRADQIDILIVLAGRFDWNRFAVSASRPAPIRISFHDPATSGLSTTDYLITDPVLLPRHADERLIERPLRVPSFYLHAPIDDAPLPGELPSRNSGHVTFGCFNNPVKINDRVLMAWADVLKRVPNSRLILKYQDAYRSPTRRERILQTLTGHGIDPSRIDLPQVKQTRATHLANYASIDIALDSFPFSGSTTTFEALWMGLPVVTLEGDGMAGRWSAAMLKKLGLGEFVASSPDEYTSIAVSLARDAARLAELRATLRERVRHSPLCDARGRTRQVERLLRAVWRRWCRNPDA